MPSHLAAMKLGASRLQIHADLKVCLAVSDPIKLRTVQVETNGLARCRFHQLHKLSDQEHHLFGAGGALDDEVVLTSLSSMLNDHF